MVSCRRIFCCGVDDDDGKREIELSCDGVERRGGKGVHTQEKETDGESLIKWNRRQ